MFTTGSADGTVKPSHVYAAFKACAGRPKIYAELRGQYHTTKTEQGFDAHFLACHTAGIETSCAMIYSNRSDSLCNARNYVKCEIVRD